MVNRITVSATCPLCGPVEFSPDQWNSGLPVGGVCPGCGARFSWSAVGAYLSKFTPDGTAPGELPIGPLTFTVSKGKEDGGG